MDPYEKAKNTRTDLLSITPPFMPAEAEVMTVRIEYPPGDPGVPPHRHPGGPCFGYILEGEMVFRGAGRAAAGGQGRRGILGARRGHNPLSGRQQPHRPSVAFCRDHAHGSRPAVAGLPGRRRASAERLGKAFTSLRALRHHGPV